MSQGTSGPPSVQLAAPTKLAHQHNNGRWQLLALIGSVGFLLWQISDYDRCFQQPECIHNFTPCVVREGNAIGPQDLVNAFNVWGLDGDSRARPVSYLCYILTVKCRLALWHFVPMHPSFSPLWLLTLVLGPMLFYRFLRLTFDSTPLAQIGTALYLTSQALLSSAVCFFHPGKPLTNLAMILALYLAARARRRLADSNGGADNPRLPRGFVVAWVLLMPLLLLADETAAYCLLVPLVWAPEFFWPRRPSWKSMRVCLVNVVVAALPALVFAAFVLLAMPRYLRGFFWRDLRFPGHDEAAKKFAQIQRHPVGHACRGVAQRSTAALARCRPLGTVDMYQPMRPWPLFVLYALVLAAALACVRRQGTYWSICRRSALLAGGAIVFMIYVVAHTKEPLVLTGYYYAGFFSVLLVVLLTSLVAALLARPSGSPWIAGVLVAWLMAVPAGNFITLTNFWREHSNSNVLSWLTTMPFNPYLTHDSLAKIEPLAHWQWSADIARALQIQEVAPGANELAEKPAAFDLMYETWRRRNGPPTVAGPLAVRDLWMVMELYYLRGPGQAAAPPPPDRLGSARFPGRTRLAAAACCRGHFRPGTPGLGAGQRYHVARARLVTGPRAPAPHRTDCPRGLLRPAEISHLRCRSQGGIGHAFGL